jgi:hypothetical protein
MLNLFVPTGPFQDWGEYPSDWMRLSQLIAELMVIVSLAALTLTLCRALLMLSFGELAISEGFGPPPSQHVALRV